MTTWANAVQFEFGGGNRRPFRVTVEVPSDHATASFPPLEAPELHAIFLDCLALAFEDMRHQLEKDGAVYQ